MFGQTVRYHQTTVGQPDYVGFVVKEHGGNVVDLVIFRTSYSGGFNATLSERANVPQGTGAGQWEAL